MVDRLCSKDECDRRHYGKGLCVNHYNSQYRASVKANPVLLCGIEGCGRAHNARGLCNTHYQRSRAAKKRCAVNGCGKPYARSGYCRGHFDRSVKFGDPLGGEPIRDRAPNGSPKSILTSGGYVLAWAPNDAHAQANGYALEHKLVVAQMIGRALLAGENVHHLNGAKNDNRPENLELWVTMQPTGQRPADLVAYAHEILARYEVGHD